MLKQVLVVALFVVALPPGGGAAAAVAAAGGGQCPMNVTAELQANPWLLNQCLRPDNSHCCEVIVDFIKILHFAWLHSNNSFLLPDNATAATCIEEITQQLTSRGIDAGLLATCNLGILNFIDGSRTCHNITNVSSFERTVDTSRMQENCNATPPGVFDCRNCIVAMSEALNRMNGVGVEKSNCPAFVLMYVAGGINCYDGLGPDAAYCLLSLNLSAVADAKRPTSFPSRKRGLNGVSKTILVTFIPSLGAVIGILICVFVYLRRVRSVKETQRRKLMRRYRVLSESTGLTFYSMSQIRESTSNFSDSNLVGEGSFGMVYRGTLADGSQIAVKRFKDCSKQGDEDFSHEVQIISSTKHRNLLPLRGYCVELIGQAHEQLLVYDFMENGSLADYLFSSTRPCLTWPQRYKIAVGIARGLAYLHEDTNPAIIHRDVKAANVLLDKDLSPLVADFGMAKFKTEDKTHYTTRTVGTLGYVAPEYALYGHLNDKSDVFSFGIVVLELLTGRRAFDTRTSTLEHVLISDWVVAMTQKGRREEIIDERIRDSSGSRQCLERVLLLGLQCAHPRNVCRPSISQALLILEAIDHPSPDIVSALQSMELDLESSCNSRGDFTWLISPDACLGPSSASTRSNSFSSDDREFPF